LLSTYNEKYNKKPSFSNNDFFPILITHTNYYPFPFDAISNEKFNLVNDTLLPIRIKYKQLKHTEDMIFWFKITENLFTQLPDRYRYLQDKLTPILEEKRKGSKQDIVSYFSPNIMEGLQFLRLSNPELEKLGFVITNDKIKFYTKSGFSKWFIHFSKDGYGVSVYKFRKLGKTPKLLFLSDTLGFQFIKWTGAGENKEKMNQDYFTGKVQELVPVLIKRK
jgi:hypothetical protein